VSELTSELQRMADDAARQARPPAAADIIRQGDLRRRRSLARQSVGGLSAAGVVGAGVALGLGLTGPAGSTPAHGSVTIRTDAFTIVSNANGTDTLTMNAMILLEPGTLQADLVKDGIPALVTVGSFCSSDPEPTGFAQVVSPRKARGPVDQRGPGAITINPAAMPAGTELSFGNFKIANGGQTSVTLIDKGSYTCTSATPTAPPSDGMMIGLQSTKQSRSFSESGRAPSGTPGGAPSPGQGSGQSSSQMSGPS
jgi:hypothetical protein